MVRKYESERWYWPQFGNVADAEQASNGGFWAALFCGVVTALFATVSVVTHASAMGIGAGAYVDAALFGLIAWRIRRRSKAFAVAGLCLFVLEKIFQYATQPQFAIVGLALGVVLLMLFINGVRGTFAYHRMSSAQPPLPVPADEI